MDPDDPFHQCINTILNTENKINSIEEKYNKTTLEVEKHKNFVNAAFTLYKLGKYNYVTILYSL